jgi:CubicO group peptidase (beta-lactamase class C family)
LGNNYIGYDIPENAVTGYQKRKTLYAMVYKLMVDKKYYGRKDKTWQEFCPLFLNGPPYGGISTNARGLSLFGLALLEKPSLLLKPETQKLLFTSQFSNGGKPLGHSLGFWGKKENDQTYYFHPGGGGGSSCEFRIYPETGIVTAYLMYQSQTLSDLKLLSKLDAFYFTGE